MPPFILQAIVPACLAGFLAGLLPSWIVSIPSQGVFGDQQVPGSPKNEGDAVLPGVLRSRYLAATGEVKSQLAIELAAFSLDSIIAADMSGTLITHSAAKGKKGPCAEALTKTLRYVGDQSLRRRGTEVVASELQDPRSQCARRLLGDFGSWRDAVDREVMAAAFAALVLRCDGIEIEAIKHICFVDRDGSMVLPAAIQRFAKETSVEHRVLLAAAIVEILGESGEVAAAAACELRLALTSEDGEIQQAAAVLVAQRGELGGRFAVELAESLSAEGDIVPMIVGRALRVAPLPKTRLLAELSIRLAYVSELRRLRILSAIDFLLAPEEIVRKDAEWADALEALSRRLSLCINRSGARVREKIAAIHKRLGERAAVAVPPANSVPRNH